MSKIPDNERIGLRLEQAAMRTSSKAEFGAAVIKQAMYTAAAHFRAGNVVDNSVTFEISITVRVTPRGDIYPPPPDRPEVDVPNECVEISASFSEYINCEAQDLIPGVELKPTLCTSLWEQYEEASSMPRKWLIWMQLVQAGCIDLEKMFLELELARFSR